MIIDDLQKAIKSEATLRIRYFGGSSPGSERELLPISLKDGKVRALCTSSGEIKTFSIEKMELAVDGTPSVLAIEFPAPAATLEELADRHAVHLQELGWIIMREVEVLSLHRTFKNGKLVKNPDVAIQFIATISDLVFDGEDVFEANHRDRSKPWLVSAKRHSARSFKDFSKAQLAFLEFAETLSPTKDQRTQHQNDA